MKKLLLPLLFSIVLGTVHAQLKLFPDNKVGIGLASTSTAQNTLDVKGNIQMSNATIPMGLMMEVGGTTPLLNLSVNFREPNVSYSNIGGAFRIDTRNSSTAPLFQWLFRPGYTNQLGTTLMVLNSSGQLGIGKIPECELDVAGIIMSDGVQVTSDARLKENIKDMTGSLATLTRLNGVTYKLKNKNAGISPMRANNSANADSTGTSTLPLTRMDSVFYSRNHIGFLAQDVQNVFPELVYTNKEGLLSVDYISLIPVMVESIKELKESIETLIKENEELKKRLVSNK